jgi:hypothetical protein
MKALGVFVLLAVLFSVYQAQTCTSGMFWNTAIPFCDSKPHLSQTALLVSNVKVPLPTVLHALRTTSIFFKQTLVLRDVLSPTFTTALQPCAKVALMKLLLVMVSAL